MRQARVRTIHYGIGAIGVELVRLALNRPEIEVVGAIDAHPEKAGKDLGEVVGLRRSLGIQVHSDPSRVLRETDADVVIHATGSRLPAVYAQILEIVSAGKSVISSCEELSFPWHRYPDIAQEIDRQAREAGVRVLGSGVNPGFVMDALPLAVATACQELQAVRMARIVDVAQRRRQLQVKTGVGLSVESFHHGVRNGDIGHIGLLESACMVADALGWPLDDLVETIEPVVAGERRETEGIVLEEGQVAGVRQVACVLRGGREVVRLELEMSMGVRNPRDEISIEGRPPISITVHGGVQGDLATAAIMVNCVPALASSRAEGLLSMREMPMVPYLRPRRQLDEELV